MSRKIRLFFIVLVTYAAACAHAEKFKPLALYSPDPAKARLVIGGSFGPITAMHEALMADSLFEHQFSQGTFLVAHPYKPDAEPGKVAVFLTCISVQNFDRVLHERLIPFSNFRIEGPCAASWIWPDGRKASLNVSDFDVKNEIKNSNESIRHFAQEVGDPRNLWWLSGGDSAASMPKWGVWWKEMFRDANMIIIGRKSDDGKPTIDHEAANPLDGIYPADFMGGYRHESRGGVHAYQPIDSQSPAIWVLSKRTLPISSSLVRRSVVTPEQTDAETMLSPAVYRAINEHRLYKTARHYFTLKNLQAFLLDEFRRIELNIGGSERFNQFAAQLIDGYAQKSDPPPNESPAPRVEVSTLSVLPDPNGHRSLEANLSDLRNQLLLSDPNFLVSRVRVSNGWGLSGHSIDFNLVKSELAPDVPLAQRQAANQKFRWHDLNISANELRNMLQRPLLADWLKHAAGGSDGAYLNFLFAAVQKYPDALLRFELFSTRRYVERLAGGAMRPEFFSELNSEELAFERWAHDFMDRAVQMNLSVGQLETVVDLVSDFYLLSRLAHNRPELLKEENFWSEFVNLAVTEYPGEKINLQARAHQRSLILRLRGIAHLLREFFPGLGLVVPTLNLKLDGVSVARLGADGLEFTDEALLALEKTLFAKNSIEQVRADGAAVAASYYLGQLLKRDSGANFFLKPLAAEASFDFVSRHHARTGPDQNLIRHIHYFYAELSRELSAIQNSFLQRALPPPQLSEPFQASLNRIDTLKKSLEALEKQWLTHKKIYALESIDARVPGYLATLETYQAIQRDLRQELSQCRAVSFVAMGMVADLETAQAIASGTQESILDSEERLWNELIEDILQKYFAAFPKNVLGDSWKIPLASLRAWSFAERRDKTLLQVLTYLLRHQPDGVNEAEKILAWLRQKYGLLDERLLRSMEREQEGSYQSPAGIQFFDTPVKVSALFDPRAESSLSEPRAYIHRKWGGLKNIAQADRIVFSDLGTRDTLEALRLRGFNNFFQVNAPYSMRGSKILVAFEPGRLDPLVVFHSFVGEDLLQHKLMQLSYEMGDDFSRVRRLSSDGLKSWERARIVVSEAISSLKFPQLDDLVLGYGAAVDEFLARLPQAYPVSTLELADFAQLKIYSVATKSGLKRTIGVLSRIEFRYFGRSVLPLVQSFLSRGVGRVIFAGSAGVLDRGARQHNLLLPRSFSTLEEDGALLAVEGQRNDLYDLAPMDQRLRAGPHASVSSPLVESRSRVSDLRRRGIVSIDVEGAQIARLIAEHNVGALNPVRLAVAFIATDAPLGLDDGEVPAFGLHSPRFQEKESAKQHFVSLLKLLWDLPGDYRPSYHTRVITEHYVRRIAELRSSHRDEEVRVLWSDVNARIETIRGQSDRGSRVSRGLIKALGDIRAELFKEFSDVIAAAASPLPEEPVFTEPSLVSDPLAERIIVLQSLTRSSTVSSGNAGYNQSGDLAQARERSRLGAEAAVDLIFARRARGLNRDDVLQIHRHLTGGVLDPTKSGRFSYFEYRSVDGGQEPVEALLDEYFAWLSHAEPTLENGIEAYIRFEQIHPFADASGRTAELIAQHFLLRAGMSPLLFPNRFDIDYILSLRRNGSQPAGNRPYLRKVLGDTKLFLAALHAHPQQASWREAHLDSGGASLRLEAPGREALYLSAHFVSHQKIALEREERLLYPNEEAFLRATASLRGEAFSEVVIARRDFDLHLVLSPRIFSDCEQRSTPEVAGI